MDSKFFLLSKRKQFTKLHNYESNYPNILENLNLLQKMSVITVVWGLHLTQFHLQKLMYANLKLPHYRKCLYLEWESVKYANSATCIHVIREDHCILENELVCFSLGETIYPTLSIPHCCSSFRMVEVVKSFFVNFGMIIVILIT